MFITPPRHALFLSMMPRADFDDAYDRFRRRLPPCERLYYAYDDIDAADYVSSRQADSADTPSISLRLMLTGICRRFAIFVSDIRLLYAASLVYCAYYIAPCYSGCLMLSFRYLLLCCHAIVIWFARHGVIDYVLSLFFITTCLFYNAAASSIGYYRCHMPLLMPPCYIYAITLFCVRFSPIISCRCFCLLFSLRHYAIAPRLRAAAS